MLLFKMLYLDLMLYMIMLCSFMPVWVFFVLGWQVCSWKDVTSLRKESNLVELGWTVAPTVAVSILCFLKLLCLGDEPYFGVTNIIKAVGRQWYWSYEMVGVEDSYDSVMTDFVDSVDKPLRLTQHSPHMLLVTSSDVMHSFALPVFKIKLDCMPGRMNQTIFWPDRMGVFVGYCSELCGAGHAFMPMVVEVIKKGLQGS